MYLWVNEHDIGPTHTQNLPKKINEKQRQRRKKNVMKIKTELNCDTQPDVEDVVTANVKCENKLGRKKEEIQMSEL